MPYTSAYASTVEVFQHLPATGNDPFFKKQLYSRNHGILLFIIYIDMENKVILNNIKKAARILLGLVLVSAGTGHLTFARKEFQAQVPPWLPLNPDLVVILSGIVEIGLGASLIFLVRQKVAVGWIVAVFFVLVFPGNIAQLVEHRNAFGLNTDTARWLRLPLQVVLIFAALWSTGAIRRKNLPTDDHSSNLPCKTNL
ncbi:MAG: hypothetical protein ABIR15_03290 [Chitinophagaceae bacterium]